MPAQPQDDQDAAPRRHWTQTVRASLRHNVEVTLGGYVILLLICLAAMLAAKTQPPDTAASLHSTLHRSPRPGVRLCRKALVSMSATYAVFEALVGAANGMFYKSSTSRASNEPE
ncbi:hypothetical protein PspLS_08264 [Pyricularia sp. CBS 133598]|nr:hypothetical protein PspLS_08264 [Pyricularia sp. CBS 133598]